MKTEVKGGQVRKKKGADRMNAKRFLLVYLGLMTAFFFLMASPPVQKVINVNGIYTEWVVIFTAKILSAIGIPCEYHGSIIQVSSLSLDVKFGCNGLEAVMIYSIAVIAFPSSAMRKVLGILVGFVLIQIVNLVRIAALAYSGIHFPTLFEYLHIYVAQGVMIAVALGVFFIFMSYANKRTAAA